MIYIVIVGMICWVLGAATTALMYELKFKRDWDEMITSIVSQTQHRAGIADGQVPFHHDGDVEVIRSHFHGRIGERDESV
jgi:hypothetical protein